MKLSISVSLALAAALFATHAEALPFQLPTGLVSPGNTITFDALGLAQGTVVTNQYSGLGASFIGTWESYSYSGIYPNIAGGALTDFRPDACPCGPTFEIDFAGPVSDAVFAFVTNSGTSTLTSYLGASLVETATFITGSDSQFTGFTGSLFDRIVVAPGDNNASAIDNLEFNSTSSTSAVPEPASLLLLGTGLVGVGMRRWRKRQPSA
jgi:hypothetical protein